MDSFIKRLTSTWGRLVASVPDMMALRVASIYPAMAFVGLVFDAGLADWPRERMTVAAPIIRAARTSDTKYLFLIESTGFHTLPQSRHRGALPLYGNDQRAALIRCQGTAVANLRSGTSVTSPRMCSWCSVLGQTVPAALLCRGTGVMRPEITKY